MFKIQSIVKGSASSALGLLLVACGQKGALYLPAAPEAAGRATLPQTLLPLPRGAASGAAPKEAAQAQAQSAAPAGLSLQQ